MAGRDIKLVTEAETIREWTHDAETQGLPSWRGQNQIAAWHIKRGELEAAREMLENALDQTDDPNGRATLTKTLAHALFEQKEVSAALRLLRELDASLITDPLVLVKCEHTLGNILDLSGDLEGALSQYEKTLRLFALADEHERADVRNNIAGILIKLGRAGEAHRYLDCAEGYYRLDSDGSGLAQTLETRARAYLAQGRYDKAEEAINASLGYLSDEKALVVESLRTKGMILARTGRVIESAQAYGQAIELLKSIEQATADVESEMNGELRDALG